NQHGVGNAADLKVTVHNVPPAVDAGDDVRLPAGGVLNRAGSFTDPSADSWTGTVDYGDGGGVQPLPLDRHGRFHLQRRYGRPGAYRVTVTVADYDGGVGTDHFLVTVPGDDAGRDAFFALLATPERAFRLAGTGQVAGDPTAPGGAPFRATGQATHLGN